MVKNLPAVQETWIRSLGREDPLEKEMVATLHSSFWEYMDSLVSYSPWGHKQLGMTEQ